MPQDTDIKAEVTGFGQLDHTIASGTEMAQQLWRTVSKLNEFKTEVQGMLPNKDSWRHPEKAREAIEAQLDYAERSLVRNTLDYLDAKRDSFMAQAAAIPGLQNAKVNMMTKHGPREVPFHKLCEDTFTDIRKSILRHDNAFFRMTHYYMEILITGGQIPPFRMANEEEKESVGATG